LDIIERKYQEVAGNCIFINLFTSPNGILVIKWRRWMGDVLRIREKRNVYIIFVGRLEGKRQFWRPRHRWEDNIQMDLKETGCEDVDLIHLLRIGCSSGVLLTY
jgi:hypothetical protein